MTVTTRDPVRLVLETPGPETVQLFTCEADHPTVALAPDWTREGAAVIDTSVCETVTVTLAGAEVPAGPVQVIWYVDVTEGVTVTLPEIAPPVENPPTAAQEVVCPAGALHDNTTDCPVSIVSVVPPAPPPAPPSSASTGSTEKVGTGAVFVSEQEALLPPLNPSHDHVHVVEVLALSALVPEEQA